MAIKREQELIKQILSLEENLKKSRDSYEKLNDEAKKSLDGQTKLNNLIKLEIEFLKKKIELKENSNQSIEEEIKQLNILNQKQIELNKVLEEQRKLFEEIRQLSQNFANDISESFGIIKDLNETRFG